MCASWHAMPRGSQTRGCCAQAHRRPSKNEGELRTAPAPRSAEHNSCAARGKHGRSVAKARAAGLSWRPP